jgi:hypothetical protein
MFQHSSITFVITFKDVTNNHYKWLSQPNMTICPNNKYKNIVVTHPKLLDGFNYESKGEDNKKRKSWGALLGSQHFRG